MTRVHRNLHTKVTFLGLEFEDLILVLALAAAMNLLAHFVNGNAHVFGIPLNIFMEFIVPALAVPFLILFKYGRPRGYLTDLARSFFAPKGWCALERDSELTRADAAPAVFASVLFAARFHEGISPLARIAKEELERGAKKPVRRGESCQ